MHLNDGAIKLAQPQLIDSIIADLYLHHNMKTHTMPALATALLHKDHDGPTMQSEFHYHSVIGKLNFLERSTRMDFSCSIHQCAQFS